MTDVSVVKVEQDGKESFSEVTNHGLVTALNSVYDGGAPEPAKSQSITSIVNAAAAGGSLRDCSVSRGDLYFGVVEAVGFIEKLTYLATDGADRGTIRGIKIGAA